MTENDAIEYRTLQEKIRRLDEKIRGWNREDSVIRHILDLLKGQRAEARRRENEIRKQYGLSAAEEEKEP